MPLKTRIFEVERLGSKLSVGKSIWCGCEVLEIKEKGFGGEVTLQLCKKHEHLGNDEQLSKG